MIVVNVSNEPLDKALKRYKKKFDKIGIVKAFRAKMQYQKKSLNRRKQLLKAIYKQKKFGNLDE
jgi:small subunit ribosomal protein S21